MSVPEPSERKTLLQSFINSFNQQEIEVTTMPGTSSTVEEVADTGVAYFVDEEGRYYYQPADDDQNIVSLPMVTEDTAEAMQEDDDDEEDEEAEPAIMTEFKEFQTVTLMPSENSSGGVSYVLVVQEDPKQVVNIIQSEKNSEDVYNFEEEDEEGVQEGSDDDNDKTSVTTRSKHSKYVRPRFTCNFCSYTSHRRYLLLRHMKSHSEDRPHKCEVCERGFKTIASLQNHVNMHNGVKPHVCKYCNSPFTTSGELVRHIRYKHTHEKPHKCTECDYASVELSKLRRHVRCHTGERPYQCPHCTYASPDTFKLKRHLRTHTGEKPYKCDYCNLCFTQSNSLKAHKLIHNVSEKPVYACELCPTKCGRKTDLRIHIQKLHTSDKPLKCKICAKTFPDRYSCKVHYKTHEGEKCFKCEICMYASTTIRRLKSHMLKHTNEKPFVCEQCDQRFRQKQLLRRHQNLYHNPEYVPKPPKEKTHTCHECHRTFAHKGNLIRHLAVHDPESGHHERVLALKLGRQKKAKRVDGHLKEICEDDSDSEENEQNSEINIKMSGKKLQSEYVTVTDGDNQQYVVLEVIHLEDGTEQQVTVMAPEYIEEDEQVEEEEEEVVEEEEEEEEDDDPEDTKKNQILLLHEQEKQRNLERTFKLENDVDTCFGFDEEEDIDDADDEVPYEEKALINLV